MHYFSGKGCSESLESMHYCIGILTIINQNQKIQLALILWNGGSQSPDRWLRKHRNNHAANKRRCIWRGAKNLTFTQKNTTEKAKREGIW